MKPRDPVKLISGAFSGRIGVVLSQKNAKNANGVLLPDIRPESNCYWVMLTLDDHAFAALLHRDEIAPVSENSSTQD
jgi:hypothetical protein